jgi:DNA-binding beta-propeller fold protein YncE
MRRASLVALSVIVAVVDVALAQTAGYSGSLQTFAVAFEDVRATRLAAAAGGDKNAKAEMKALDSVEAALFDSATKQTYLGEIKAAAQIAKTVGTKLKSETTLPPTLGPAATRFRYDLDLARTDLAALVDALSGAQQKKTKARLKKADKALAAAAKAHAAGKPVHVELTQLANAAKLLSPTYQDPSLDVRGEPVSVAIDSTGNFVYVAEYGDMFDGGSFPGDVRQMQIFANGSVSYLQPASISAGVRPYGVVASPKAPYVYVGDSGEATIAQFSIGADGALVPLVPATVTLPQGTGVEDIVIDGAGRFVYTIGYGNGGSPVTGWKIGDDGTLSVVNTAYAIDFPTALATSRIDPVKGGWVIASGRYRTFGLDPQITTFSVGADGTLTTKGGYSNTNAFYALALSPGGGVSGVRDSGAGDGTLSFFNFDLHDDGRLVVVGDGRPVGFSAYSIGLSKTGTAFVGNWGSGSITVFGKGAVVNCPAPYGFATTPDGKRLIVGNHDGRGAAANIVTVFGISGAALVGQ